MWFIYNVLFTLGYALMLPKFLMHMRRRGGYRRDFGQRLGCYAPDVRAALTKRRRIWIHAVSVGEVYIANQFMKAWRVRHPDDSFVLSTTSSTGHCTAEGIMGDGDVLIYYPADFPAVVRRVLNLIRPTVLILAEGEIWPNMLRCCAARGIPVAIINGRMSARSHRGYRCLRPFVRSAAEGLRMILVQTAGDAARWRDLGVPAARIALAGSLKYDLEPVALDGAAAARATLARLGWAPDAPVLVGGSTWAGEEQALLDALRVLRPRFAALRLVLVPRHAERRAEVLAAIAASGFTVWSKSGLASWKEPGSGAAAPDVLLVDTTGELRGYYAAATLVFVGKSLTQTGGQNIIEPAVEHKAILTGPHLENFPDIAADFDAARAFVHVATAQELASAVGRLLDDPEERIALGARAAALVEEKRGALARSVAAVEQMLSEVVKQEGRR
ncbi:MAG: 3-deoxy-D-manno-octulosonic acid transferase [bacterium]